MDAVQADERDVTKVSRAEVFRVTFFEMTSPNASYSTEVWDLSDTTFTQVHRWAEERAGSRLYGISLIWETREGREETYVVGTDANNADFAVAEKRGFDEMVDSLHHRLGNTSG